MPKPVSLNSKQEIIEVFEKGNRLYGGYANLYYLKNREFSCLIVVKKKFFKKAVKRNKIRRRVKAVLQKFLNSLSSFPNLRLIFILKPNADTDFKSLHDDLMKNLNKLIPEKNC